MKINSNKVRENIKSCFKLMTRSCLFFHNVTERNTEDQRDPDLNSECTTCTGTGHTRGPHRTSGVRASEPKGNREGAGWIDQHSWLYFSPPELHCQHQKRAEVSEKQQLYFLWPDFNS